jgi:beta-lactamase regulating signal transducer with metallopeptidase domain
MLQTIHTLSQPLVESLGWSLVHFLWQGLVLANVLLFLLFFLRRRSANARYLAACGVLLAMAACPVATFAWIWCHADLRPPVAEADIELQVVPFDAPLPDGSFADRTAAAGPALSAWEGPAGEEREASPEQAPPPAATSSFMPGLLHAVERTIPWLVLAWLAGVAACSLRLGLGWLRLRQLKSAGSDAAVQWQDVAAGLAQRLGVSRPVRFLESLLVEVPTVVGWLRPVVLLPARALTGLTPAQLESLLAHELAHIRRNDYVVNLLQTLIETLLFYHPVVWWVSGRVRQEREHCCDDLAVRVCRDRLGYVRALAALEELRATAPRLVVAAGDGSLLQRVRRLLGSPEARPGGLHVSLVTLLAVLLIATTFVAPFVIPAGTVADRPQHDQPTGAADGELAETTLLASPPVASSVKPPAPSPAVQEPKPAPFAWNRTDKYIAPDFEGYFPDDADAGKRLDDLFRGKLGRGHKPEAVFEIVRRGLRRTSQHKTLILAAIGKDFVWNQPHQHPQAIELLYHASAAPDQGSTGHYAMYHGLTVVSQRSDN